MRTEDICKLELGESKLFPGMNHEQMLMEMCNKLLGVSLCVSDYKFDKIRISGIGDVHWLEACLVHLPKALATPNNRAWDISVRQAYHLQGFYYHSKHIVDYLYVEFKNKINKQRLR